VSGFHDVSLPLAWALGARGGPTRRTDVITLGSGREARSTPWAHGRRRYDIGGTMQPLQALSELAAFFEARRGKLYAFRFRDILDHRSGTGAPTDQSLGVGDGQTRSFSLRKAYGQGSAIYWRAITKPVPGSVRAAIGALETPATLDALTGRLTFANAPASGAQVTAGFQFDTPVRFDIDALEFALDAAGAGRALSVPLIEVLS
jgi:uncharacterized protein (TIGR02217 family)